MNWRQIKIKHLKAQRDERMKNTKVKVKDIEAKQSGFKHRFLCPMSKVFSLSLREERRRQLSLAPVDKQTKSIFFILPCDTDFEVRIHRTFDFAVVTLSQE